MADIVYVVTWEGNTDYESGVSSVHRTKAGAEKALIEHQNDALEDGENVCNREGEWDDSEAGAHDWTVSFEIVEKELGE